MTFSTVVQTSNQKYEPPLPLKSKLPYDMQTPQYWSIGCMIRRVSMNGKKKIGTFLLA